MARDLKPVARAVVDIAAFLSLLVIAGLFSSTHAQDTSRGGDRLADSVLRELRDLRAGLHDDALQTLRTLVLIERWRAQQTVVKQLADEWRTSSDQVEGAQAEQRQLESNLQRLNTAPNFDADPEARGLAEREQQATQQSLDEAARRVDTLQEQERQIAIQLKTEQQVLSRLSRAVNALES